MNVRSVSFYPETQKSDLIHKKEPATLPVQVTGLELAGTSSRMLAYLVDTLLILTLCVLYRIFTCTLQALGLPLELVNVIHYSGMLVILMGYHLLQEWKWQGRTVGKALLRIRVVSSTGSVPGFWQILLRSLFRVVDVGLLGVGLFFMLMTRQEKRLGDITAGTLVVLNPAAEPAHFSIAAFLGEWGVLDLSSEELGSKENILMKDYASRREHLSPRGRERFKSSLQATPAVAE